MHAFWLVLTYDLLKDRRIDDVIIKTFALCYSKMAESFENLDDILADWVNEDFEKTLVEAVESYDKQEKEINHVSLSKTTWQNYLSSRIRTRLKETQNG